MTGVPKIVFSCGRDHGSPPPYPPRLYYVPVCVCSSVSPPSYSTRDISRW
ncbi:hypothetical protein CORC01_08203 [Colletotrichum orchidophilum]|uniref:Uncharacterized protein n=1 Tax=Colletotrichum orchidophilum TaxID=1209926 RepID=A0A1G4B4S3_9PEZI|nr:uncharacterized protein CORC01_08203 [Colletotrichum orchidophilum]OHE96440.1 hypothetical protein CORC01_08203 [Colletotrichum orchidophilum]